MAAAIGGGIRRGSVIDLSYNLRPLDTDTNFGFDTCDSRYSPL